MMLKNITRNLLLGVLITCMGAQPLSAAGGEAEYHSVVKLVESYYHVKHKGVPMLANLGLKAAKVVSSDVRRAMRFGDFKLAYFEDQDFTTRDGFSEFHRLLRQTLIPGWDSLLAVRQRDEGLTYTFVKPDGDKFKVLIVVLAQRDGTVLQVNLDRDEFAKLLQDPEQETRNITDEASKTANNQ